MESEVLDKRMVREATLGLSVLVVLLGVLFFTVYMKARVFWSVASDDLLTTPVHVYEVDRGNVLIPTRRPPLVALPAIESNQIVDLGDMRSIAVERFAQLTGLETAPIRVADSSATPQLRRWELPETTEPREPLSDEGALRTNPERSEVRPPLGSRATPRESLPTSSVPESLGAESRRLPELPIPQSLPTLSEIPGRADLVVHVVDESQPTGTNAPSPSQLPAFEPIESSVPAVATVPAGATRPDGPAIPALPGPLESPNVSESAGNPTAASGTAAPAHNATGTPMPDGRTPPSQPARLEAALSLAARDSVADRLAASEQPAAEPLPGLPSSSNPSPSVPGLPPLGPAGSSGTPTLIPTLPSALPAPTRAAPGLPEQAPNLPEQPVGRQDLSTLLRPAETLSSSPPHEAIESGSSRSESEPTGDPGRSPSPRAAVSNAPASPTPARLPPALVAPANRSMLPIEVMEEEPRPTLAGQLPRNRGEGHPPRLLDGEEPTRAGVEMSRPRTATPVSVLETPVYSMEQLKQAMRQVRLPSGTSLVDLSQQLYGDSRYALALLQLNHRRADDRGQFIPGTQLNYLPAEMLRYVYPDLIQAPAMTDLASDADSGSDLGVRPVDYREPETSAAGGPVGEPFNRGVAPAPQWYVTEGGESLFQIAAETFDQASFYLQLFEWNREQLAGRYRPTDPLPRGLRLRLAPGP